jgi:nitrate reductase NapD
MSTTRHYAGVLIRADPGRFERAREELTALAGIEVHHTDPATGRFVVILDTGDRAGQEKLFERLRSLPGVRGVDLVYHLIDREPTLAEPKETRP